MTTFRAELDVDRVRTHFDFARCGRIVTNNAATTQPPRQLLDLYRSLVGSYDNVHRGQSTASLRTTALFEESYDTIASWLERAEPTQHRHLSQYHRGDQRGDVFATH